MIDKEFIEEYQLYRKFEMDVPEWKHDLWFPPINQRCKTCGDQTFSSGQSPPTKAVNSGGNPLDSAIVAPGTQPSKEIRIMRSRSIEKGSAGKIISATYNCANCSNSPVSFYVYVSEDLNYVMKVGQWPPPDTKIDKRLEKALGKYTEYFRKGLISEYQGYGIGANAYYRRIVDEIIDDLLKSIGDFIEKNDKEDYKTALDKTKKEKSASNKIDIVKHLLPTSLTPEGFNPLAILHDKLSVGIHALSDQECLEDAVQIRAALTFLVKEVRERNADASAFVETLHKLDKKRSD